MPTGAKLVSAIYFTFITYVAAQMVHNIFEANIGYDLDWGNFAEITAVIGLLVGWQVMGPHVGDGRYFAIQRGILSSVACVFWSLILWALVEMIKLGMDLKYPGPTAAIVDGFRIALEYGKEISTPLFWGWMIGAGIFGGLLAEFTSKRFR